jgi:hypothetical protein
MATKKKGTVRVSKKGSKFGMTYEVPNELSDKEKIEYAKKEHKKRSRKRPYNVTYKVIS